MDKISISDFCGEEKTYAQLIQDLYFHISVKELYMVLASNAAQNRDVYESVSYRNTYSSLENRIPDVCRMTVGELLRYATEKCLSGRNMEELYDEDSIKLGYKIIKQLLVFTLRVFGSSFEVYHDCLIPSFGLQTTGMIRIDFVIGYNSYGLNQCWNS